MANTKKLVYGMIIGSVSTGLFITGLLSFPFTHNMIMKLLLSLNKVGILLIFISIVLFIGGIYYNGKT